MSEKKNYPILLEGRHYSVKNFQRFEKTKGRHVISPCFEKRRIHFYATIF